MERSQPTGEGDVRKVTEAEVIDLIQRAASLPHVEPHHRRACVRCAARMALRWADQFPVDETLRERATALVRSLAGIGPLSGASFEQAVGIVEDALNR